jgi:hypothetical protein
MTLCRLITYFFDKEPAPTRTGPHNHVAIIDVSLDIFMGDGGDLHVRPVADLLEWTSDPSPCLMEALARSCRCEYTQVNPQGNIRGNRFWLDEHPSMLVGLVSKIKTPTRRVRFTNAPANIDEALQAIEAGMMVAPHQLMLLGGLIKPSGKAVSRRSQSYWDPVAYWTCMAIRMSRSKDFDVIDPVRATREFENVESLYAAASHLVQHPQLRRTWEKAASSTGDAR